MSKYTPVIEKYKNQGISETNIDYAMDCAINGYKREHALESLTADYRKLDHDTANAMLNDFYGASGGEFRVENKKGYLNGIFLLLIIGLPCTFYIGYVLIYGGIIFKPVLVGIGAIVGVFGGLFSLIQAMRGKYREDDDNNPYNSYEH